MAIMNQDNKTKEWERLFENFVLLNQYAQKRKINISELHKFRKRPESKKKKFWTSYVYLIAIAVLLVSVVLGNLLNKTRILDKLVETTLGVRCVLPNNYFVWEATRPVTDCSMCVNLSQVIQLDNSGREDFADFAYTSQPIVIRNAAKNWSAVHFNFQYFQTLFADIPDSYETIEEDCQFLSFKTEFLGLRDVFNMTEERIHGRGDFKPWYVGWSVCHPEMVRRMREFYPRPHFLPEDAEHSHLDYVFMGYQQGAVMHLDYISRLMWQAQLVGRKTWDLKPPPECDHVCSSLSVDVEQGDIIVLDTRQWYHDTHVEPGVFSLTVSSEYG